MTLRKARNILLAVVLGGMPLGTVSTCDYAGGQGAFFYDQGGDGFFAPVGGLSPYPYYDGPAIVEDYYYEEEYVVEDVYYDDYYYYDDCSFWDSCYWDAW
jgi:hypothetical protein